jgi:hypothetical protein
MTSAESIFVFSLVAIAALQAFLTVRVWRAQSYDREQKVAQTKLIWLLPVLGAVLVFSLMPEESDTNQRPKSHLKS